MDQEVEEEERKRLVSLVVLEMTFRTHMQEERESEGGRRERATTIALEMRRKERRL